MIRIITDTASDFTPEEALEQNITLLPIPIQFGEKSYLDKYELSTDDFYSRLIESDDLPKTSQITPYTFLQEFEKVREAGDSAVVIVMSGELSNTAQNAMQAALDFDNIHVVDSKNVTIGEYCLIQLALKLRGEGRDAKDIADELLRQRERIRVIALLDTLEYLKKGGRISATTAWAGGLLAIKPVVSVTDGKVLVVGKARGSRNGNNMLMELVEKSGGIDFSVPYRLGYSGLERSLLNKYIADSKKLWEGHSDDVSLPVLQIGCTIGTHIGPGTVALAFFAQSSI